MNAVHRFLIASFCVGLSFSVVVAQAEPEEAQSPQAQAGTLRSAESESGSVGQVQATSASKSKRERAAEAESVARTDDNRDTVTADESTPRPAPRATVHAPVGGRSFALADLGIAGVICGRIPGPWRAVSGGRMLIPPALEDAVGEAVEVSLAPAGTTCDRSRESLLLVATGPKPLLAPESLVWSVDEGRLDGAGRRLQGAVLWWSSGERSGHDVCHAPTDAGELQRCTWSTGRDAPADPDLLRVGAYPEGSRPGPDALFVDERGRPWVDVVPQLKPPRLVVQRVFPVESSVDLSTGEGELSLVHSETVAAAECRPLDCEMRDGKVVVRGSNAPVNSVQLTLRLRPRVFLQEDNRFQTQVTGTLGILSCPMRIVSGEAFRNNDGARVAVRLDGLCARDVPRLEFRVNRRRLRLIDTHHDGEGTLVLLHLGSVGGEDIVITASRASSAGPVVVAVAQGKTRPLPPLRAVLEVRGFPNVDFIPTNRWAHVHVAPPAEDVYAVALPILGVYETRYEGRQSAIRGDHYAAGLTGIRLGVRSTRLPTAFAHHNLAVVDDPLLRSVHEANVPAQLVESDDDRPLVELHCGEGQEGPATKMPMGETVKVAFGLRDTCRVLFYRDRLAARFGAQHIRFEMDVYSVDGTPRGEAHVAETVTLSPGTQPRKAYVHGILRPFDRLVVRIAHDADDTHYLGSAQVRTGAPEAKWSLVFGTGRARLYATTTFPTGLYRLSSEQEYSGLLSLNFGLLSRLTWLDDEGQEGFLGMEAGLVVVDLGDALSNTGQDLNQVGIVLGVGLSVPFANRSSSMQAAINVHAWIELDITSDYDTGKDGRLAFIFGPSISIGNLGTNL